MRNGDIADSLFCLGMAVAADLPDIEYERRLPKKGVPFHALPTEKAFRRPYHGDCEVHSFPQQWGHGSLGFGGMGTASMETAQTTVVIVGLYTAAIYFGRQLAYVLKVKDRDLFWDSIRSRSMAHCEDAGKYGEILKYGSAYVPSGRE